MREPKVVWISILILVIIGLHALPVLSWQGHRQTRWPILSWAMYAKSYPPGPIEVLTRRMIATAESGAEEEIKAWLAGLPFPAFRNAYLVPMSRHDSAAPRALLAQLNKGRSDRLVALRLVQVRSTLTDTGVVREELPVINYSEGPSPEGTP
jgi:hypothetical protein